MPTANAEIARRLELIPTASLYDILDGRGMGEACCLSLDVRPLVPGRPLAGPAFTWRLVADPRDRGDWDPAGLETITSMFAPITSGDVVVVDGGGPPATGDWGEMLSIMARRFGARGAVVDGGTRDTVGIKALGDWPVYARFASSIESLRRKRLHEVQVPLLLDGALGARVQVRPGDWVLADDDAVIVIPTAVVMEVLAECEDLEEVEEGARQSLIAGDDFDEVFARYGRA